jgi:phospholipid/cholesterol/gamma-HCH transport system permease protein
MATQELEEKIIFSIESENILKVKLLGNWRAILGTPGVAAVLDELKKHPAVTKIAFDSDSLTRWDSGLLAFLFHLKKHCRKSNIRLDTLALPAGVQKILSLSGSATAEDKQGVHREKADTFIEEIGRLALKKWHSAKERVEFLGEVTEVFVKLFSGKARFRAFDFFVLVQQCSVQALPIVSLISFLVGLVFAFVGVIQLRIFGAQIYVADIVGIAMVRVMGAVMTGIIMAGRTGAAYAARLGTMQTNEEIDALKTTGVSPIEFLVLPRILALVLMMPLLCLYADLMGILGGYFVGITVFNLNAVEYLQHTKHAVSLNHMWVGLVHSFVFGIIVSLTGCFKGMQSGRSAAEVGDSVTSAVVSSIIYIVVATAIIIFVCEAIGV